MYTIYTSRILPAGKTRIFTPTLQDLLGILRSFSTTDQRYLSGFLGEFSGTAQNRKSLSTLKWANVCQDTNAEWTKVETEVLHQFYWLVALDIQDNQHGLITHPFSTKWSEQTVVPFHKRKLPNFSNHCTSNFISNLWKPLILSNQNWERDKKNCQIYTTQCGKFNFMQVQPLLITFQCVPGWTKFKQM